MKKHIGLTLTVVLLIALFLLPVNAWVEQGYKYSSTQVPFYFQSGIDSYARAAWSAACQDWYNANTKIQFTNSSGANNQLGSVYMEDAAEHGWMDPTYRTATTIHIFSAVINTAYPNKSNEYRSTANHELGHVLGLGHTSGNSIMNGSRDRSKVYTPKSDDIVGVITLYGL